MISKAFLISILVLLTYFDLRVQIYGFPSEPQNPDPTLIPFIEFLELEEQTNPQSQGPNPDDLVFEEPKEKESYFISQVKDLANSGDEVPFIQLRLKTLMSSSPSEVTELLELQEEEMKESKIYRDGWREASRIYHQEKGFFLASLVFNGSRSHEGQGQDIPEALHISLIALGLDYFYSDFKRETGTLCSGRDIFKGYPYKSYFVLLRLALSKLSSIQAFQPQTKFLYHGLKGTLEPTTTGQGQSIMFQTFIVTSSSLKGIEALDGIERIFEFQGQIPDSVSLRHHLTLGQGHDDMVVLSPGIPFRVQSVHPGFYNTRYVLTSSGASEESHVPGGLSSVSISSFNTSTTVGSESKGPPVDKGPEESGSMQEGSQAIIDQGELEGVQGDEDEVNKNEIEEMAQEHSQPKSLRQRRKKPARLMNSAPTFYREYKWSNILGYLVIVFVFTSQ